MIFPIESLATEHRELGLVVAVLIGFGFGFVLERAGFGRATKLAGQFYMHDMTVFKVMFGAIVTAMLGAVVAAGLGLADLTVISESVVSPTFIWPMLVGGLMLGVGFIVSGYCPGTSLVATASGNLDGLVTFVGVIIGSTLYSEIQPHVQTFHDSGAQGHLFLYELLGIPPAILAVGITVMALAAFFGAEKLERIFKRKYFDREPEPARRRPAFAVLGVASAAAVITLFFPIVHTPAAQEKAARPVAPAELARRVFDEPWKMRILDLREESACTKQRVPGAECAPLASLAELGIEHSPEAKDLVLVASDGLEQLPAPVARFPGQVFVLSGGWAGWKAFALEPPEPPPAGADGDTLAAYRFRTAVHRAMTGAKAAPPPPRKAIKYVPKKRKKTGGCG